MHSKHVHAGFGVLFLTDMGPYLLFLLNAPWTYSRIKHPAVEMSAPFNWPCARRGEEEYLAPGVTGEWQSRDWDPSPSASGPQASLACWMLPLVILSLSAGAGRGASFWRQRAERAAERTRRCQGRRWEHRGAVGLIQRGGSQPWATLRSLPGSHPSSSF